MAIQTSLDPYDIMEERRPDFQEPVRVLSLFSGGGGLDIAFRTAGCDIVASVELISQFCDSLKANSYFWGHKHKVFCADICKFNPREEGIKDIDFIIGGPPCQSFSAAGRRAGGVFGVNDIRGSLFWHYCRILKELNPKGFLFENVRGILSANSKHAWQIIQQSFSECGYSLFFKVLDSAEFGVPQFRERVILIGVKNTEVKNIKFPLPLYGPKGYVSNTYRGAGECIADLQCDNEEYHSYGGIYEDCLKEIPPGMNYLFFTEKMGHPNPRFAWRSRFSDFLYVADPATPTKTIVASPGKWCGPFHWKKRRFNIGELKRLFTFPDKYILTGTEATQVKQLGNSVPPLFGFNLALTILSQLFSDRCNANIKLADTDFIYNLDTRKGQKARATKGKVKPNKYFQNSLQGELDLFADEKCILPEISKRTFWYYKSPRKRVGALQPKHQCDMHVSFHAHLKAGLWVVNVVSSNKEGIKLTLQVDFFRTIGESFRSIQVNANNLPCEFVAVLWDAVDFCICESSSYDNIQRLYGHFTEPYPQFKAELFVDKNVVSPYILFATDILKVQNLKSIHDFQNFPYISKLGDSLAAQVRALRTHGFDVRSNETNRTIPEGSIRVCYPFTMSLNELRFTAWREKGYHKTADTTSIPNVERITD